MHKITLMPRAHLTATVDPKVKAKVEKQAKKEKRNLSNMVEFMLTAYLEEHADSK